MVDYIRVLLVDDDEIVRMALTGALEQSGFVVTCAAGVPEALKLISGSEPFDVLLSDLHMPGPGDGLTVVSAMRHANPKAATMLLSAFPQMNAATQPLLFQTDEILVKPMDIPSLIDAIKQRVANGAPQARKIESVAAILERTQNSIIQDWYREVEAERKLKAVPLSFELRSAHLPQLFADLIDRLRSLG